MKKRPIFSSFFSKKTIVRIIYVCEDPKRKRSLILWKKCPIFSSSFERIQKVKMIYVCEDRSKNIKKVDLVEKNVFYSLLLSKNTES